MLRGQKGCVRLFNAVYFMFWAEDQLSTATDGALDWGCQSLVGLLGVLDRRCMATSAVSSETVPRVTCQLSHVTADVVQRVNCVYRRRWVQQRECCRTRRPVGRSSSVPAASLCTASPPLYWRTWHTPLSTSCLRYVPTVRRHTSHTVTYSTCNCPWLYT